MVNKLKTLILSNVRRLIAQFKGNVRKLRCEEVSNIVQEAASSEVSRVKYLALMIKSHLLMLNKCDGLQRNLYFTTPSVTKQPTFN